MAAEFTTVRSVGGLLPGDVLQRVARADRNLDGLTADAYHLAAGERLREVIARSWARLTGAWAGFRAALDALPPGDTGTTLTREKWLLVLFGELGYGRLQTATAVEVDGLAYPVSHAWARTPIHLVSARFELDKRVPGAAGAARWSPHALVQELLNRSDEHLWGMVSNGRTLRVLRDNLALTRPAYVEFDLQAMFDGEVYADFALLWMVCHQSRVEAPQPAACWLERWVDAAQREGTRALDALRDGVERALVTLGTGFLAHPDNGALRARFRGEVGEPLDKVEYYRQLLRLVYRLLFLFVAEDRDLLLTPLANVKPQARDRYQDFYSTARLRRLARRHAGGLHGDLWRTLVLVSDGLGGDAGLPELALPPLGGALWDPAAIAALAGSELSNAHLLEAVRALAYTERDRVVRVVDYRNMESEELGSVYEALLELHPDVDVAARAFTLTTGAGSERKTTGSYYTPTSLVTQLLDTALDPVLAEAAAAADPEQAILDLKVIDPACGSGHFLVAAAHRIARRLATIRSGEGEPSLDATREALREVVSRCVYGVDVNPMALELARVSLWLEAHVPGKPLTFLDHHLRVGNSLLGATPALLARGVPDDAFKPLEGDDRKVMTALKHRNARLRGGQQELLFAAAEGRAVYDVLGGRAAALNRAGDATIADLRAKERFHHEVEADAELQRERLAADAWCASFVAEKTVATQQRQPFEAYYRLRDRQPVDAEVIGTVRRLNGQYGFFHWHLEFRDVFTPIADPQPDASTGWAGGFDVVLGNPPWEHTELKEKEFFAARDTEIAEAAGAKRKQMIAALAENDAPLHEAFVSAVRQASGLSHVVRNSGRYPLCGKGRINTYAIFAETNRAILGATGRAGFIVQSGIATDDTTKDFFGALVDTATLASLYDFENRMRIFPAVDSRMKFCLLTLAGADRPVKAADFAFFALDTADLADPERRFTLSPHDIALLNPNTKTCPVFRTRRDAEITKAIYRRVPVLIDETRPDGNPWGITFKQGLFNMTSDSGLFRTRTDLDADGWTLAGNVFTRGPARHLPLYEGRFGHQFNHRFAEQPGGELRALPHNARMDPTRLVEPHYWVAEEEVSRRLARRALGCKAAMLGFRRVARSNDDRTSIAALLPLGAASYGWILSFGPDSVALAVLAATYNSFALDDLLRNALSQPSIPQATFEQVACPSPEVLLNAMAAWSTGETVAAWLAPRVLELTYTAWDLQPFAADLGVDDPPFRWDPERRFLLRCELDAAFFHLYGICRDDAAYILDTFPIVRRKDEATHGEYRTKRVILDIYDELGTASETGEPYRTRLNPPPADAECRHAVRP